MSGYRGLAAELYSPDGQQFADNMANYIRNSGAPLTTENLNRLSLAVAQEMTGSDITSPALDATIERQMQPARPRRPAAQQRANVPPGPYRQTGGDPEGSDVAANAQTEAAQAQAAQPTAAATPATAAPVTTERRGLGRGNPSTTRRGTIPRAQRINEDDPTAGMFNPNAPAGRQADETGVDQAGLGMAILSPLALLAGTGAGGAAATGASNLGVTLARRRLAAPGAATRGVPPSGPAAIPAPQTPPMLPGPQGAAALPPPARMIAPPSVAPTPPTAINPNISALQQSVYRDNATTMAGSRAGALQRPRGPSRGQGPGRAPEQQSTATQGRGPNDTIFNRLMRNRQNRDAVQRATQERAQRETFVRAGQ